MDAHRDLLCMVLVVSSSEHNPQTSSGLTRIEDYVRRAREETREGI
jgi:hypothetical protein